MPKKLPPQFPLCPDCREVATPKEAHLMGKCLKDDLYDEAYRFVTSTRKTSISALQRKLRIGYNRAARLIESLQGNGVVSDYNEKGGRDVLVDYVRPQDECANDNCNWQGLDNDKVRKVDWIESKKVGFEIAHLTCPKCGNNEFYEGTET